MLPVASTSRSSNSPNTSGPGPSTEPIRKPSTRRQAVEESHTRQRGCGPEPLRCPACRWFHASLAHREDHRRRGPAAPRPLLGLLPASGPNATFGAFEASSPKISPGDVPATFRRRQHLAESATGDRLALTGHFELGRQLVLNRGGAATIVAGAVLGLSCTGSDARIEWRGTIDTTAGGTIVVSNPAQGLWDSASAWRVVEELRIGTAEGSGPDLFGNVGAIEVDGLGRLWVAETQAQELRVFDREGGHVRTVGRKGGGPGEFRQINVINTGRRA